MSRAEFEAVLERAAAGWAAGDAAAVAECFAAEVAYGDPYRYRFDGRTALLPFFEPPVAGHHVTWHTTVWDDVARIGVVEYTYEGHHRYHGAALAWLDDAGRIARWREWQHLDDATDWATRIAGPPDDAAIPSSIDHVQLGMPAGADPAGADPAGADPAGPEDDARRFYVGALGLREVEKPPELAGRGGAWFAGRSVAIHLGLDPDFRPSTRAHPALVVDDLDAALDRLRAIGVTVTDDDSGLSVARAYVHDPFGNRIELVDAADAGFSAPRADDARDRDRPASGG